MAAAALMTMAKLRSQRLHDEAVVQHCPPGQKEVRNQDDPPSVLGFDAKGIMEHGARPRCNGSQQQHWRAVQLRTPYERRKDGAEAHGLRGALRNRENLHLWTCIKLRAFQRAPTKAEHLVRLRTS